MNTDDRAIACDGRPGEIASYYIGDPSGPPEGAYEVAFRIAPLASIKAGDDAGIAPVGGAIPDDDGKVVAG